MGTAVNLPSGFELEENGQANTSALKGKSNFLKDFGKGFAQGVSSLGVGLGKNIVNPYIRPLLGKKPLSDAELDKRYGLLDDKPQSTSQKVGRFVGETAPYLLLPQAKVVQGTGTAAKLGNAAVTGAYQGATVGGTESIKNKGITKDIGKDVLTGAVVGGAISPAVMAAPMVTKAAIESPAVTKILPEIQSSLTSVPAEYYERALTKELTGDSIFTGKFDAKTAYQPIETKLREAKNMLPTAADFGNKYYELAQKAEEGMQNLKNQAGTDISNALNKLDNKTIKDNNNIQNAVDSVVNSFGEGGIYNTAKEDASKIVDYINDKLKRPGLTFRDLHRVKERLYDKGYAAQGLKDGITADVARGTAEQINNYIRRAIPEYARPNDIYSMITDVERGLDNVNTLGSKIRNIGSNENAVSGLDQRLKNIDNLLPKQNKFYKSAQNLINNENEVNEIRNIIGKQYERNPRLLANRNDLRFENALNDLQTNTGVNFMDDLNDIRAREALEKFFPGQGGGFGSEQGFGNALRTGLLGGAPTAALITHNPLALFGLGLVSPRIMGKGSIRGLGALYNLSNKSVPAQVVRPLPVTASSLLSNQINAEVYPNADINMYNSELPYGFELEN